MWVFATGLVLVVFVGLVVRGADSTPEPAADRVLPRPAAPPLAPKHGTRPNIVFILTDDLSWNLVDAGSCRTCGAARDGA